MYGYVSFCEYFRDLSQRYGQASEKPSLLELFSASASIFAIYRKVNYLPVNILFFGVKSFVSPQEYVISHSNYEPRLRQFSIMQTILKHFPNITERQIEQFTALYDLYTDWNSKINVISRKDIDNLYPHHIIHSLAIAKVLNFESGTTLLDIGTGGGFPGIPLAILFPECQFTLIDSIGKKIKVATEVANAIGLKNVTCIQERAEMEKGKFDFVISRAVMPLGDLVKLIRKNVSSKHQNAMPNGLMVLKGGNLEGEIHPFRKYVETTDISKIFSGDWYKEKFVLYLPL